jgi:membrane protease subunit (stomatin/prohibitin family)
MAIEVLEWQDESGQEMVWRHPGGELKLGAQLVVSESQWAIFFRDGRALDTFATGRHTLTTANLPLLARVIGLPFGGKSPFRADVYFVARKVFPDLKWGTKDPVVFRDAELAMVRLRAHGVFAVRVVDAQVFVNSLVGSQGRFTTEEIEGYLRGVIVARLNDVLGESLKTLFDLPRLYDELAEALKGRVAGDFAKYGLALTDFFVNAITPPEDVQKVLDERTAMSAVGDPDAYLRFKAARALGDAAAAAGGGAGDVGSAAAAGLGLGAGMGLGAMLPGMLQGTARPASGTAPAAPAQQGTGAAGAKFCTACGTALPEGARFCGNCGKAV